MGGSKKVTIGYFHDKDMQMSLCHGPIDAVVEIRVADRVAHTQWMDESGTYTIDKENLFGGKSKEGGIKGQFDLMMGLPDQPINPYIQEMVGDQQSAYVPAYRRLVTVLLKKMYVGMNPYWRQWLFLCKRIFTTDSGEPQWYPEKAQILEEKRSVDTGWQYVKLPYHSNPGYEQLTPPDSGWSNINMPMNDSNGWTRDPDLSVVWAKRTISATSVSGVLKIGAENGCVVWVNGTYVGASNRDNLDIAGNHNNPVEFNVPAQSGDYEILIKAFTESSSSSQAGNILTVSFESVGELGDLNPAHIIREALTSREWGKGATNIDDVALTKMADQLYEEGLGISLHWQRSTSVNELLKLVCDHISAVFPYVDTTTGLWTTRLIREDQVPVDTNNLIHLHDGNIVKIRDPKIRKGANAVNTVHVKYTEVATNSVGIATANSLSGIAQAGGSVIAETIEYKGFTNQKNAMWACRRDLQTLSARVKTVEIEAHDDIAEDLQKGDFFWWSNRRLGIDRALMMVQEIDFGDYLSNTVSIKAIEYAFGTPQNSVVEYIPTKPNVNIAPKQAEVLLFEAPYREAVQRFGEREVNDQLAYDETSSYLLVAVKRPQDNATGATLFTSVGGEYEESGVIDFCATAQLRNDIDQLETVFELKNITDAASLEVGLAIEINGERMHLVDFNSVTRDATVKRGIDDTIPRSHSADSTVWFYDEFAVADETTYTDLQTVFIKASTLTQTDALSLTAATEHSIVMCARMNRPYPPANVKINDEYWPEEIESDLVITWSDRNRLQQTGGEPISWFESSVTLETGVSYQLILTEIDENNVVLRTQNLSLGALNTYTLNSSVIDANARSIEITLKTLRDGYECYQPFVHTVQLSQFFSEPYDITYVVSDL